MEDLTDQMRTKEEILKMVKEIPEVAVNQILLEIAVDIRDQLVVLADDARSKGDQWKDVVDTFAPILQGLPDAVAEKKRDEGLDLEDIPEVAQEEVFGRDHGQPGMLFNWKGGNFCEHGTNLDEMKCAVCEDPPRPEQPGKKDFVLPKD